MAAISINGMGPYRITKSTEDVIKLLTDASKQQGWAVLPLESGEVILVNPSAAAVIRVGEDELS